MENYKQYNVLVVDDDETLRNTIILDFKRKGFTVLSAQNGADAFEIVKKNKIHLVVSDMRMPGGDGMGLLENIRNFDSVIPQIIFVTGFADVAEEQALAKGARKILAKPFDRKVLMNCALEYLGIIKPLKTA